MFKGLGEKRQEGSQFTAAAVGDNATVGLLASARPPSPTAFSSIFAPEPNIQRLVAELDHHKRARDGASVYAATMALREAKEAAASTPAPKYHTFS